MFFSVGWLLDWILPLARLAETHCLARRYGVVLYPRQPLHTLLVGSHHPPRLRDPRPNSSAAIWRALGFLLMRAHDLQCKFLTSKSVSKSTSSSHVRDLALRTLGSDNSDEAVESQGCLLFTYFMGETYMSFEGSSMFLVIVSNVSRHLWNHLTS